MIFITYKKDTEKYFRRMTGKKSILTSTLTFQCPACNQSSMYENPSLYALKDLGKFKSKCDACGTNLHPESGFYFGAAYVSWGLTVALWVSVLIALKIFDAFGWIEFGFLTNPITFLTTGVIATIVVFPYLYRLSRSVWAHMFIKTLA